MEYTRLMVVLTDAQLNKQAITISLKNGVVFNSTRNTCAFESTNCLDLDDPEYLEYYACGVEITELIQIPNYITAKEKENYVEGKFIELSEIYEPLKVEIDDGTVIWENQ